MKLYLWFYIGFQKAKQFWLNKYNSSAKIRCACLPLAGEGAQLDSLSLAQSASMDSLPWSSSSSWPPSPTFTLPPAPGCTQLRRLPDLGSKKAKPLHDSKPTPNKTAFNSLFIHNDLVYSLVSLLWVNRHDLESYLLYLQRSRALACFFQDSSSKSSPRNIRDEETIYLYVLLKKQNLQNISVINRYLSVHTLVSYFQWGMKSRPSQAEAHLCSPTASNSRALGKLLIKQQSTHQDILRIHASLCTWDLLSQKYRLPIYQPSTDTSETCSIILWNNAECHMTSSTA